MNDATTMVGYREIIVDELFPHAPEAVWETLTTPALMARWLMEPTGFKPIAGTQFTYQTKPAGAWDGVIHCEVLDVVPNERLVYSWQGGHPTNAGYGSSLETVVTFTLHRVGGGTRLRLVHSGFQTPKNDVAYDNMSNGWTKVLDRLEILTGEGADATQSKG
jgi:uncharacterized protein YndB with AHSA1/START domain